MLPPGYGTLFAGQRLTCGEVTGRVRTARFGTVDEVPLEAATVSIDGSSNRVNTDTAGFFRLRLSAQDPTPAILRIRRIGFSSAVTELPGAGPAFTVDVVLNVAGFHEDRVTKVVVRQAWTCENRRAEAP